MWRNRFGPHGIVFGFSFLKFKLFKKYLIIILKIISESDRFLKYRWKVTKFGDSVPVKLKLIVFNSLICFEIVLAYIKCMHFVEPNHCNLDENNQTVGIIVRNVIGRLKSIFFYF